MAQGSSLWFYKREDLPLKTFSNLLLFKKSAKRKEMPMISAGVKLVGCEVPKCGSQLFCGWRDERSGKGLRTCQKHLHKHHDKGDPFSFYLLLKIPVPPPIRKDRDTMGKKKKTAKANGVGSRIAAMFTKKGVKMKTREIEAALNKGKKPEQQASIHAIRAAIKGMIADKQLVVVEVVSKQFVLAKYGTPRVKAAKVVKKTKKTKKKVAKKKKAKK